MQNFRRMAKPMTHFVIVAFLWVGLQLPAAQAGMIGTETLVSAAQILQERSHVLNLLERKDIQDQLMGYGVTPEQAKTRVDSLSDAEIHTLADQLDSLPAGGDVVGVILFIFLVLLLTDILGLTDVFPFVKKHRRH